MRPAIATLVIAATVGCFTKPAPPDVPDDGPVGDDGPAGDADPRPRNHAFVTSQIRGPGELGGVTGADDWCEQLALSADMAGTYVAWVSSATSSPQDRMRAGGNDPRGWIRPDGRPFADTVEDILARKHWYPLRITETGQDVPNAQVATGTTSTGGPASSCAGFTDPTAPMVTIGLSDISGLAAWTQFAETSCSTQLRVYCFQIDHHEVETVTPESQRMAFVSATPVTPTTSVSQLDAVCQADATGNGLPGTFLAAVATTSTSVKSRFTPGAAWVRFDGATVISANFDRFVAPIAMGPDGTPRNEDALTGTGSFTEQPVGTETCDDYSSTTGSVRVGWPFRTTEAEGLGYRTIPCDGTSPNPLHLYCLRN